MKKLIAILASLVLVVGVATACAKTETDTTDPTTTAAPAEKIKIVTTIFPIYDWVKEIIGGNIDNYELTMLLDDGVDLHSYQPTTDDMIKLADADMFITVGGHSDEWVEDALNSLDNKDLITLDLVSILGDDVKDEEEIEGMEAHEHEHEDEDHEDHEHEEDHDDADEHEEDHDEDHEHEEDHDDADEHEEDHDDADEHDEDHDDHEHEEDADEDHEHEHDEDEEEHHHHEDEHVWLSLNNAVKVCATLATELGKLDAANAEAFSANVAAYTEQLTALDGKYSAAVEASDVDTLLFADRFPFRYLVDDYDLDYFAAFAGCSAESEASFETISFLAEKVNELNLENVFVTESSDQTIAKTVINTTTAKDQEILVLDSMQATTAKDVQDGATYLSIMEGNLAVLEQAL